jgi:hypothetical protein
MKALKVFLGLTGIVIIILFLILGYFGFVPGLSNLFGSNKPRDLGTRWTEADRVSGRTKTGVIYQALPAGTPIQDAIQTSGSKPITTQFTATEMTAIFNNKPVKFWPFKDVQLKFNANGSGEISGVLLKSRIPDYAAYIGAPKEAVDLAMKFLPVDPVFYVKGVATLSDNKVGLFEPQKFEIGRVSLPVNMFLSFVPPSLVKTSYAVDVNGLSNELSGVSDKRSLIINFINERLTHYSGFFANTAKFEENKLIFDGTLPEKESSVQ